MNFPLSAQSVRRLIGSPLHSLSLEEQGLLFEQWLLIHYFDSCSPLED